MSVERKLAFIFIMICSVALLVYLTSNSSLYLSLKRFKGKKIVYNLTNISKGRSLKKEDTDANLPASQVLKWTDTKTGEILFDVHNIIRFDWEKQIFELSRRKAMGLMGPTFGRRMSFTVSDKTGMIYNGAFENPASSSHPLVPTIKFASNVRPPLFSIGRGYRTEWSKEDLRFSERMKVDLAEAGVLSKIDLENPPLPIKDVWSEWAGKYNGARASIWYFPETFRIGEPPRMHIEFISRQSIRDMADVIECVAVLKSNRNKYQTSTRKMYSIKKDIRNIYVFEFMPWGPSCNSPDSYAVPGPAEISGEVVTRKMLDENTKKYSAPFDHIKIKPFNLTILPKRSETEPFALDQMHLNDWATVQNRLKTKLIPLNKKYGIGQPMRFRLEMINISSSPVEYMAPSSITINDPMIVKGPKDKLVPYIGRSYGAGEIHAFINNRQTISLVDDFDISSLYHIVEPGRYTIQFKGLISSMRIPSNILQIDIEPGELSPGSKIVERLFSVLPNGWTLSKSDVEQFFPSSGVVTDYHVTMYFEHAAINIHIQGVPRKVVIPFVGEFYGQSKWGIIHVEQRNADLFWPNFKEAIIKALEIQPNNSMVKKE